MPVWSFILALIIGLLPTTLLTVLTVDDIHALAFVYVIPIGMIQAITNQQVALKCVNKKSPLTVGKYLIVKIVS